MTDMKYKYYISGNEVSREEYMRHPSTMVCCGEEMNAISSRIDKRQEHSVISGTEMVAVRFVKHKCSKCGKEKENTQK